jgi:carbon-monoxide dehydrogenase medium subunit
MIGGNMIPGPFAYHRPESVADAIALLVDLGDEARPLAGGHSLIPMMKLRLATPDHLIDLAGIGDLKGISRAGERVVIRAMTTQQELLTSDVIASSLPILHETALLIADPQVRYRGTLGGNVANGDPGNDMPALMMMLGAAYVLEGPEGERTVAARDFYQGAYFTALEPGEILTSISIPVPLAGHGYAYEKLKRKIGDYATAAAAVVLTMKGGKVGHLLHRPHQSLRDGTGGRGCGQGGDRQRAGRRRAEEGGRGRDRDHGAGRRRPRSAGIPQACRRHHGRPGAETRRRPRGLKEEIIWPRLRRPRSA